jgi:abortive infection bacteriophage resistance protein
MLKQPSTHEQQIEILLKRGCAVPNEEYCRAVLSRISYYSLSAYFLPFKTNDGNYVAGTNFNNVYLLFEFDRHLRHLLFFAIEEIEVFLRANLSYFHAHKYGADGYKNPVYYNSRHDHERFMARINDVLSKNKKVPFVRHHKMNYAGEFPIWVIMELFTFGMLSYFYADLTTADQKLFAHDVYKTTPKNIKSWLYCCTDLRNFCAHYGRLYYRIFTAIPSNIPQLSDTSRRSLFGAIMALRALFPDDVKWNNAILTPLAALVEKYTTVIDLEHIGFPDNWEFIVTGR